MKDPKELQKQAEEAAKAYANFYEFEDSNWVGAVKLGYRKGYISGFSSRDAEVEQLREALKEVHGLCMALRHGIFTDTDTVNTLISKAIIASALSPNK